MGLRVELRHKLSLGGLGYGVDCGLATPVKLFSSFLHFILLDAPLPAFVCSSLYCSLSRSLRLLALRRQCPLPEIETRLGIWTTVVP